METIILGAVKHVENDTSRCEGRMTTAVAEASLWLNHLTMKQHRGRGDTLSAARDRAARMAGIPRAYAKRLWDRAESMTDLSAEAYRALKRAYEASCEHHENRAAQLRAERLGERLEMAEGNSSASVGTRSSGAQTEAGSWQ